MRGRTRRPAALLLACALASSLLVACSGRSERPAPTVLEELTPSIAGRQVWSQSLGTLKFPLALVAAGDNVIAATDDGSVIAYRADTGQEAWRGQVDGRLSAGVGSDGRYAAVVTRDNVLVTLDGGKEIWRRQLPSRVSTPPLVAGERVFVMGVDRVVQAHDVLDGRKLWTFQRPGDALTLSQPGVLAPFKDTLLAGQGSKLAGLDPLRGTVRWEVSLASPRGTNEIERLADLVGPAARVGDNVCARAFQAAVACVNAERGSLAWTRNVGGLQGVAADEDVTVAADASDRITAWRTASGEVAWSLEKLLYRGLSTPLLVNKMVVFGDVEGLVHWLSAADGTARLRLPTDGSPVVGKPLLVGQTVIVTTRNGGLFAFRPE